MEYKDDFLNQSIATEILTSSLEDLDGKELSSFKKNVIEMKGVISGELNIQNNYFTHEDTSEKTIDEISINANSNSFISTSSSSELNNITSDSIELGNAQSKILELEKENNELKKENDELNNRITELFKMMNELLKIEPKNNDFSSNYQEIKNRITLMFYREIRLKHVLPFSRFVSPYGINTLFTINNTIKKSNSTNFSEKQIN